MNRDFLKEAIADAKAVKESAIANAKAALEEAFTPHLKSMLAAKLEEMEYEEMDEINSEEVEEAKKQKLTSKKDTKVEEYKEEHSNPETGEIYTTELKKDDDEMDLDELLAELEGEEKVGEVKELKEAEDEEEVEAGEEAETDDESEVELEDMTDDDLKSFIEDVIKDMIAAGELEAGHEGMEDETAGDEEVESIEDEEVDLDELVYEAKKEKEMKKAEDKETKKKLDEAYNVIHTLRAELNEINLLNAKLLYSNKIFKSKTLSESQKVKVLNAFDKATSVKEVKVVFETLNESFQTIKPKNQIRENLGLASKATGVVKSEKSPIVETDLMVSRFQKLAGIK